MAKTLVQVLHLALSLVIVAECRRVDMGRLGDETIKPMEEKIEAMSLVHQADHATTTLLPRTEEGEMHTLALGLLELEQKVAINQKLFYHLWNLFCMTLACSLVLLGWWFCRYIIFPEEDERVPGDPMPTESDLRKNVRVIYYLTFTRSVMRTMAYGPFFDIYLYELCGRTNSVVGWTESARGTMAILTGLCTGFIADKICRAKLVQASAAMRLIPTILMFAGVWYDNLTVIIIAVLGFAISVQIGETSMLTLLPDCLTPDTNLITLTSHRAAILCAGLSVGPAVQIMVLLGSHTYTHGHLSPSSSGSSTLDGWTLDMLRRVILCGLCVYVLCEPAVFFLRSIPLNESNRKKVDSASAVTEDSWRSERVCGCMRRGLFTGAWAELCWFAAMGSAGMTINFVPLFWRNVIGLTPAALLCVQIAEPWGVVCINMITPRITKALGTGLSAFLLGGTGALTLYVFTHLAGWWPAPLCALLWMIRTGCTRGVEPCIQSIVFNCVPSTLRGRWSGIATVKGYSFSMLAIVGGKLADRYGYIYPFDLTALTQVVAALCLFPLSQYYDPLVAENQANKENCFCMRTAANDKENDATAKLAGPLEPKVFEPLEPAAKDSTGGSKASAD